MKKLIIIVFLYQLAYGYCSYDDCTMDVVSESISLSYDIYDAGQEIVDIAEEWQELNKEYMEVTKKQVEEVSKTRKVMEEYLLVLKEINFYKEKIVRSKL